jgi:hypothetical protein
MKEKVSTEPSLKPEGIFLEPKLPDFDVLSKSDKVLPALPSLNINDLPAMDVMSENFRSVCASTSLINEFMDVYDVAFTDRISLIKGILAMAHGAAESTRSSIAAQEKVKYLAEGGKEYYGMYL